jgi:hypothetical protein
MTTTLSASDSMWDFRSQVFLQEKAKMAVVVSGQVVSRKKKTATFSVSKFDLFMNPKMSKQRRSEKPVKMTKQCPAKVHRTKITITELVNKIEDNTLPNDRILLTCFLGWRQQH